MPLFKTVKIIFYLTALLLAMKPFIGFGVYGRIKSQAQTNVFVKVFSKRAQINNKSDFNAAKQQLAEPLNDFLLHFSFLLAILFPLAFITDKFVTTQYLQQLQLNLQLRHLSLFTGQLLI
jgi:hypothetical protein